MTWTQLQRWKGFAVRMARRGWPDITKHRQENIESEILSWFREMTTFGQFWKPFNKWEDSDGYLCLCDWVDEHFEEYACYDKILL